MKNLNISSLFTVLILMSGFNFLEAATRTDALVDSCTNARYDLPAKAKACGPYTLAMLCDICGGGGGCGNVNTAGGTGDTFAVFTGGACSTTIGDGILRQGCQQIIIENGCNDVTLDVSGLSCAPTLDISNASGTIAIDNCVGINTMARGTGEPGEFVGSIVSECGNNLIIDGGAGNLTFNTAPMTTNRQWCIPNTGGWVGMVNSIVACRLVKNVAPNGRLQSTNISCDGTVLLYAAPHGYNLQDVSLTADDTAINPTRNRIRVSSDTGTGTDRTFWIDAAGSGAVGGGTYVFIWTGTNAGEVLDDSNNMRLNGNWNPTQYDTLTVVFNGTDFVEQARSSN